MSWSVGPSFPAFRVDTHHLLVEARFFLPTATAARRPSPITSTWLLRLLPFPGAAMRAGLPHCAEYFLALVPPFASRPFCTCLNRSPDSSFPLCDVKFSSPPLVRNPWQVLGSIGVNHGFFLPITRPFSCLCYLIMVFSTFPRRDPDTLCL